MNDDKKQEEASKQTSENKNEEIVSEKNPLNKNDDKKITQQDVENEQIFKEAQTERD